MASLNPCRKPICRLYRLQDGMEYKKIYSILRKGIDYAIQKLASFHEAKEIIEKG